MERVSCSDSCPGLFSRLKEVYLFGCNTLDPDPVKVGSPEIVRGLLREGLLVDLDGTIFTATAVEKARLVLREGFERHGSLTVSQARDLLGSSRKYVLAILAHFDAEGVTRRRGDERFPGPRLGG